jgi:hypothetical protein
MKATISNAIVIALAILMTGCGSKTNPLPNGYGVFVASKLDMFLVDANGAGLPRLAGTDLKEVGSYNELIFGRTGDAAGAPTGFFLFNSSNGQVIVSLSEGAWLKELKVAGVPMPPERLNPRQKPPTRR